MYVMHFVVHVLPRVRYVSIPGGDAVFKCTADAVNTRILSVMWIVNNTDLDRLNLSNVVSEFSPIGNGVGALHFPYLTTCGVVLSMLLQEAR